MRAEIGGALPLANTFDGGPAHAARLPRPVVDHGLELEVTGLPVGIGEVPQCAAALGHCPGQDVANGNTQLLRARPADARRSHRRPDAGQKERFGCVYVPHPHDKIPGQQHLLDRRFAALQTGVERGKVEGFGQRLEAEAA